MRVATAITTVIMGTIAAAVGDTSTSVAVLDSAARTSRSAIVHRTAVATSTTGGRATTIITIAATTVPVGDGIVAVTAGIEMSAL